MHKILLVEDEKILRDAYTILLNSDSNYQVNTATNGKEALDFCKKETYDLILLDLMMPVLDGMGFLKAAMLAESSPKTRVVIMSNLSGGKEVMEAMKLGAHRHAVKSDLGPTDVMAIVEKELDTASA
jgi:DNA-binding response OmpR family regulator